MTRRLAQGARVALAFFVVASVAMSGYAPGGQQVSPVEPVSASDKCDLVDTGMALAFAGASALNEFRGGSSLGCDIWHKPSAAQDVYENESTQDELDIYQAGLTINNTRHSYGATIENYQNESEAIAWMKAEKALAECYEAGNSKAVCKTEARQAIADYYSVKQINHIEQFNSTITSVYYIRSRAENESAINKEFVDFMMEDETCSNTREYTSKHLTAQDVQLANGSTHTSVRAVSDDTSAAGPFWIQANERKYDGSTSGVKNRGFKVCVTAPNSNYESTLIFDPAPWESRWNNIVAKNDELQNETDAFVEATWNDFETGSLNATDMTSRTTDMFEYGSAVQNGTADYYDVLGATAALGVDTPNLDKTGTMTITDAGGSTYDGMLFGNAPDGTWEVGTEYDPANISGPVQFATTDGQLKKMERPFTLERATDKQGNDRSTVETQKYNYQTANTTETLEKYDRLLNATKDLQARSEESVESGGGGGSSGGSLPGWLTDTYFGLPVWLIAALLIVLLAIFGGGS